MSLCDSDCGPPFGPWCFLLGTGSSSVLGLSAKDSDSGSTAESSLLGSFLGALSAFNYHEFEPRVFTASSYSKV